MPKIQLGDDIAAGFPSLGVEPFAICAADPPPLFRSTELGLQLVNEKSAPIWHGTEMGEEDARGKGQYKAKTSVRPKGIFAYRPKPKERSQFRPAPV